MLSKGFLFKTSNFLLFNLKELLKHINIYNTVRRAITVFFNLVIGDFHEQTFVLIELLMHFLNLMNKKLYLQNPILRVKMK